MNPKKYLAKKLLLTVLPELLDILFDMISVKQLRKWADAALDALEDYVSKTQTVYDDLVVLRLTKILREAFAIPDNDDPIVDVPTE